MSFTPDELAKLRAAEGCPVCGQDVLRKYCSAYCAAISRTLPAEVALERKRASKREYARRIRAERKGAA